MDSCHWCHKIFKDGQTVSLVLMHAECDSHSHDKYFCNTDCVTKWQREISQVIVSQGVYSR